MKPMPPETYVLSADHGLRARPVPAPGCTLCGHLARWFDTYSAAGPRHDESAAVDCVVEIRNHPHDPPKMTVKEFPRPR
ncbi:hypothetical protein SLA_2342 [Streptomyces laurentii]|uniref:Uncharacterized protein n=1 Tax=Streptomyces laurentii TaxID=39478 RepID=A0A160NZB8_STRLU|nr:hypothetical protein SLA_2342 [Streptomyces laurentii]